MVKEHIPNETKRSRFKRLATKRTKKIIDAIHILENCANRNIYEYSDEDIEKIFKNINKELKVAKLKFEKKNNSSEFYL